MHQNLKISICKLFSRNSCNRLLKPSSSFFYNSFTTILNHSDNHSVPCPKPSISNSVTSTFSHFCYPAGSNLLNQFIRRHNRRKYSGGPNESVAEFDHNEEVDTINLKFVEAREEIDMAMESKETVYFDEEAECARVAVKEVVDMFEGLLAKLPENQKAALQRSMGLKIEQLKAELQQLDE